MLDHFVRHPVYTMVGMEKFGLHKKLKLASFCLETEADATTHFRERCSQHSRKPQSQSQSYITTDGQSVCVSWCRAQSGAHDQIFVHCLTVTVLSMGGRPL
jgi:hypothetical protein